MLGRRDRGRRSDAFDDDPQERIEERGDAAHTSAAPASRRGHGQPPRASHPVRSHGIRPGDDSGGHDEKDEAPGGRAGATHESRHGPPAAG